MPWANKRDATQEKMVWSEQEYAFDNLCFLINDSVSRASLLCWTGVVNGLSIPSNESVSGDLLQYCWILSSFNLITLITWDDRWVRPHISKLITNEFRGDETLTE